MKNYWRKLRGIAGLVASLLYLQVPIASSAQPLEIKLATILPRGLGQDNVLRQFQQECNKAAGGELVFRNAPGGQKDGEAGIVKKLNSGNYQAGLLSAVGLSNIEPEFAALQSVPLGFRNWEEVDFVRERLRSRLEQKLTAKGFVLLFWADSGWVNFFSVRKAATPQEFRKLKFGVWASGNNYQLDMMKSLGYQPVSLETDYMYTGFSTGMIETAPIAPTFALGVQLHEVAPHVLELNWCPIVGAAIVKNETWNRITSGNQKAILKLSEKAGREIRAEGRRFHEAALTTLRSGRKTTVSTPTPQQLTEWDKFGQELRPLIRGKLVPAEIHDQVHQLLDQFRTTQPVAR